MDLIAPNPIIMKTGFVQLGIIVVFAFVAAIRRNNSTGGTSIFEKLGLWAKMNAPLVSLILGQAWAMLSYALFRPHPSIDDYFIVGVWIAGGAGLVAALMKDAADGSWTATDYEDVRAMRLRNSSKGGVGGVLAAVCLSAALLMPMGCASFSGDETLVAPERAHVNAKKSLVIATKIYDRTAKKAAEVYSAMPEGDQREAFKENVIRVGDEYLRWANAAKFAMETHQTETFGGAYAQLYNYLVMLVNAVQQAIVEPADPQITSLRGPVHRSDHPLVMVREMNPGCTEWKCKVPDGFRIVKCAPPPPREP